MRLRKKKLFANTVNIWIKYSNFIKVSKQIKLDNSINSDDDIYYYACLLFDKLWDKDNYIRGLCVGVDNLSNNHDVQMSLFDINKSCEKNESEYDDKLQEAVDKIKERYGYDKIGYADVHNNN